MAEYLITSFKNFDGKTLTVDAIETGIYKLNLDDIKKISVITTDQGPFIEDMFVYIEIPDNNFFVVESEMPEFNFLFTVFESIGGFDYDKFIKATSSTDNAEFICYEKKN